MANNRDGKRGFKLKTRQTKIAGKLAFHRVNKLKKILLHLNPGDKYKR